MTTPGRTARAASPRPGAKTGSCATWSMALPAAIRPAAAADRTRNHAKSFPAPFSFLPAFPVFGMELRGPAAPAGWRAIEDRVGRVSTRHSPLLLLLLSGSVLLCTL